MHSERSNRSQFAGHELLGLLFAHRQIVEKREPFQRVWLDYATSRSTIDCTLLLWCIWKGGTVAFSRSSASRAASGREKKNPWPFSHPNVLNFVTWSNVSTPSAVTSIPRLPAKDIIVRTISVFSLFPLMRLTKEQSIFKVEIGNL